MKNKDLLLYGGIAVVAYLMLKNKGVAGIGKIPSHFFDKDKLAKKLGETLIDYNELRDIGIRTESKSDIIYTNGMNYVINRLFDQEERLYSLSTTYNK
jgi:hypothetical protein